MNARYLRRNTLIWSAMLILVVLVVAGCGSSDPTSGSVTIDMDVDRSAFPVAGTFAVAEGSDVLGCVAGTFEDEPPGAALTRTMTCTDGDSGTFTFTFEPAGANSDGEQTGTWQIVDASGDLSGLEGGGDWAASEQGETIEGEVEFAS